MDREHVSLEVLRSVPAPAAGNFVTTADPERVIRFLEQVKRFNTDDGGKGIYNRQVLGFKPRRNWIEIEAKSWRGRDSNTISFLGGV